MLGETPDTLGTDRIARSLELVGYTGGLDRAADSGCRIYHDLRSQGQYSIIKKKVHRMGKTRKEVLLPVLIITITLCQNTTVLEAVDTGVGNYCRFPDDGPWQGRNTTAESPRQL